MPATLEPRRLFSPNVAHSPLASARSPSKSPELSRVPSTAKTKEEEEEKIDVSENQEQEQADDENGEETDEEEAEEEPRSRALYKSSRFKGYLMLVLASGVNYQAAYISNNVIYFVEGSAPSAVPATEVQRRYAMAVALISIIVSSFIITAHLDSFTPLKKYWFQIFKAKSRYEAYIIVVLIFWWTVALWINTGINGIAGDGKGQFNLYFSSWACFLICTWTLEHWMVACEYPSLEKFMASWPNRAPGWIAIFFFSLASLLCIVDLFANWKDSEIKYYEIVQSMQWEWMFFATAFTLAPAGGFVLMEIVRETKLGEDANTKSEWEIIFEGVMLLLLFVIWIPSVIVATTPGGLASLVGNAYFFVWGTTVFVVDTCVWWIHDWRRRVLTTIQEQEKKYRNIQKDVFERSRMELEEHAEQAIIIDSQPTKVDDDDSINSDSIEGQPIADVAGH